MYCSFILEVRSPTVVILGLFSGARLVARGFLYRRPEGSLPPTTVLLFFNHEVATLEEVMAEILAGDDLSSDVREALECSAPRMVSAGVLASDPSTTLAIWCEHPDDLTRRLRTITLLISGLLIDHEAENN